MAQQTGGSRRLDGRDDIERWIAERLRALNELKKQDELAQKRVQLTLALDGQEAAS